MSVRIGRVVTTLRPDRSETLCFATIVEQGRALLSTWRAIGTYWDEKTNTRMVLWTREPTKCV